MDNIWVVIQQKAA